MGKGAGRDAAAQRMNSPCATATATAHVPASASARASSAATVTAVPAAVSHALQLASGD